MEEITEIAADKGPSKTGASAAIVVLLTGILCVLSAMGLFMFSQRERHWGYQQCLTAAVKLDHGASLSPSERTKYNTDC